MTFVGYNPVDPVTVTVRADDAAAAPLVSYAMAVKEYDPGARLSTLTEYGLLVSDFNSVEPWKRSTRAMPSLSAAVAVSTNVAGAVKDVPGADTLTVGGLLFVPDVTDTFVNVAVVVFDVTWLVVASPT